MNNTKLLEGKRGLVIGVANDHSIAWGIAEMAAQQGAVLALTYQNSFKKRVMPLAERINADFVVPMNVEDDASIQSVFEQLTAGWGNLEFVVHSIA